MEFKYKTSFAFNIDVVISKDKYLAAASLEKIKPFLPEIDERNIDLLPFACNAAVVNRVNLNDDVMDTATALQVIDLFKFKQCSAEHNRKNLVGVILKAGFSAFGSDQPLKIEDIKDKTAPFNICLGGIIWRVVSEEFADAIQESSDPTSDTYRSVSASWEISFNDYSLIILKNGQKNIEDGKIISDVEEINAMTPMLKAHGGTGKIDEDKKVYRLIKGQVVPLGIGFTLRPAADVKGVATSKTITQNSLKGDILPQSTTNNDSLTIEIENKPNDLTNNTNNISHINEPNVKDNRLINFNMAKITKITDITDDSLKEIKASAIADFIQDELAKSSENWSKEKKDKDAALKTATEQSETLAKDLAKANQDMATIRAEVETLNKARLEAEKTHKFDARMSLFDDTYDLGKEDREILAKRLVNLSDEEFVSYEKEIAVFLKNKNKSILAEVAKTAKAAKEAQEATASTQKTVDDALDNAEKDKAKVPNGATETPKNLKEKYAAAFALENFTITQ